jgi:ElaB/YqjD/DUF883 family membrane-anchored ribosome-binding protein
MSASSHSKNMGRHARNGARQLKHDAERTRNGVMHTVQKMGGEAVDALRDGYDGLRETASGYINDGFDRAESLERSVEKQIEQRPLAAVMVSLGIGFLAGILFTRRR